MKTQSKMASSVVLAACAISLALLFLFPVATFATAVLDTDGHLLKNNEAYHILPKGPYGAGGLVVEPINSHSLPCPLSVKQKLYSIGSPVTMSSPLKIANLKTGIPVSFYFNDVHTACNFPLRWLVDDEDANHRKFVIVGVDSSQFEDTYFFKIEKSKNNDEINHVYNIKFCHVSQSRMFAKLISNVVHEDCHDVGLIDGRLALTSKPFDFVFFNKAAHDFAA